MLTIHSNFKEKLIETLKAVLPILMIVLLLCFSIAPIPPSILMTFLIGAALLILGMLLFNVGFMPAGNYLGQTIAGLSISWIIVPIGMIIGYFIALALTFFVPKIFTAIAFDSGGVASGPMTATFLLPFAMGACKALGGNIITDAFGIVAMVAMTPLITIQIMGLIFKIKENNLHVMFWTLGLGTVSNEVRDYLGLESSEKAVAFSVLEKDIPN